MWVSRIVVTSLIEMPAAASVDRRRGSVLVGPGSMRATPPLPCTTGVAMMCGSCMKSRSKYDSPVASVIMSSAGTAARAHDEHEHAGGQDDEQGQPQPADLLLDRLPTVPQ